MKDKDSISTDTVCILSNSWKGGSGWFTHELARSIAQTGMNVTLIAPLMLPAAREASDETIERRVTPRVTSTDAGLMRRRWVTLKRFVANLSELSKARSKGGVFLFNHVGHICIELWFSMLVRLWRGRLFLVVHDPTPHAWILPAWARFFERWVYRFDFTLATHVICLSSTSKRVLESEYNLDPDRVTVIPHGAYDLGEPAPLPNNGQILIFGFIRPNKLVKESILAMQKFRREGGQLRLLIAGDRGPSAYTDECIALARQDPDGIELDIRFIPDEEVAAIIAQADAVLLPYRDFNSQSGVAVLAGMTARPVIGSDAGGLSDLYEMGLSGIKLQGEPTSDMIADALWRFQKRPLKEWEQGAREARKLLLQELGWPAIGRSYKSLIATSNVSVAPKRQLQKR